MGGGSGYGRREWIWKEGVDIGGGSGYVWEEGVDVGGGSGFGTREWIWGEFISEDK